MCCCCISIDISWFRYLFYLYFFNFFLLFSYNFFLLLDFCLIISSSYHSRNVDEIYFYQFIYWWFSSKIREKSFVWSTFFIPFFFFFYGDVFLRFILLVLYFSCEMKKPATVAIPKYIFLYVDKFLSLKNR